MNRMAAIVMAAGFIMFETACQSPSSDGSESGGPLDDRSDAGGPTGDDLGPPPSEPWVPGGPLDIVASRVEGVAPLLVVFEGDLYPGQDSAAPFHDLDYMWDFGDPDGGRWGTNGEWKGWDYGPVAAHVFEEPGTYTVRLAVRGADGELTTGELEVTVQDPDAVFSGTKTVCFSGVGNFSGCPAGAAQVTTSSMSQVMGQLATGKRLLLHRGESFSGNGSINVAGPGIVGAYGTGASPRIALSGSAGKGFKLSGGSPRISDWRIMDLEIDGSGASSAVGVEAAGTVRDVLMLRLDIHHMDIAFEFSTSVLDYTGQDPHDVVGIVDTQASSFVGDLNGAFLSGEHFAILGSEIDLNRKGEHTMRADMMRASVIGHTILSNPASAKSCLKLHAPTWTGNAVTDYTERVVIRRSTFIGANNDWLVTPGPQNAESNEHVRDVLLDGNFFVAGSGTQAALTLMGESMTVRNNVFDMTAGLGHRCVGISDRGAGPSPADITLLHNTCYSGTGTATLVDGANQWPNVAVANNLVMSPGGASLGDGSGADALVEGNLATKEATFVTADPADVEDFAPADGSAVIDTGATLPVALRDIGGVLRPVAGAPDVGAFESN